MKIIRTTLVTAMGLLFGVEPLHLMVVAATAATYRLKCKNKWRMLYIWLPKKILFIREPYLTWNETE